MSEHAVRERLVAAARRGELLYYSDLAKMLGIDTDNPHFGAQVGRVLGRISEDEVASGRPMLSAIVVSREDMLPGKGFFHLGQQLRQTRPDEDEITFAVRQIKSVQQYWRNDPAPARFGPRLTDAMAYAAELHAGQLRKGTQIPYLSHLLAACSLVLEDGGDEDQAIAALLHDGPEDQGGQATLDEIRERFGDRVATMVHGLSDALPALGERKEPWRPRKEKYLRRLETEEQPVLHISLADKLHNLRTIVTDLEIGQDVWMRFQAKPAEQAWYFGALLDIFERRIPQSRNLPEFRRLVSKAMDTS